MSSLPQHQQSLAGGIFNTVMKFCSAVGLGISATIYTAESPNSAALQTTLRPYRAVFWFCFGSAVLGLCFVPFLTIGTQGHDNQSSSGAVSVAGSEKLPSIGGAKDQEEANVKEG